MKNVISYFAVVVGVFECLFLLGCEELQEKHYYIVAKSFSDSRINPARHLLKEMIPENSKDIRAEIHCGGFMGGFSEKVRCKVDPKSLREFIELKRWNFRFDSTMKNENEEHPSAILEPPHFDSDFWEADKRFRHETHPSVISSSIDDVQIKFRDEYVLSGKFWSYNDIHLNGGGYRLYYDVINEVFYYDWSSN